MTLLDLNYFSSRLEKYIKTKKVDLFLKDEKTGEVIFESPGCEFPEDWDYNDCLVSGNLYLSKKKEEPEKSILQVFERVSKTIAEAGFEFGYFTREESKKFKEELFLVQAHRMVAFNSPVYFNFGLAGRHRQGSACFLQSLDDSIDSILDLMAKEIRLFTNGSGTGTNYSALRAKDEPLSSGGRSSGVMSFMKALDQNAGVIKSAGRTRRAARMAILNVTHPEIMDFIRCKVIEERKAKLLIDGGFDSDYNGDAYGTVAFQNANHSVRMNGKEFFEALDSGGKIPLKYRILKKDESILAKEIWDEICNSAWSCGDPGLQFHDTINKYNTCIKSGKIETSNPCQPGFAKVLTPKGIRKLSQVDVGDTIWSGERWVKIKRKWSTGIKKVYRYTTTTGNFVGTKNHQVFQHGERIQVRNADSIDWNILDITKCENKTPKINPEDVMDGLVLGDGSVHKGSSNLVYLIIGGKDKDYFKSEIKNLLLRDRSTAFSSHPSVHSYEIKTSITHDELPKTYKRKIPDRFYYGSLDKKCGFLRGLFTANGSICGGRVTLKQSSRKMTEQVQEMLSSIGIHSYVTETEGKQTKFSNGIYKTRKSYCLNITSGRTEFIRMIGFIQNYKMEKLKPGNPPRYLTSDIKRKKYLGKYRVYDIEVDAEEHSYWTGGCLVSNCGEYVFLDDTACNLASLNLEKFLNENGTINIPAFYKAIDLFITAMEIIVQYSEYPSPLIKKNSHDFRPLGLGFSNFGSMLMMKGIPYTSKLGCQYAGAISSIISSRGYLQSVKLAKKVGPFPKFQENKESFYNVMRLHRSHSLELRTEVNHEELNVLCDNALLFWQEVCEGVSYHGIRNSQISVIAPTGSISFLMGCKTTGIEPALSHISYKKLAGGGTIKLVNDEIPIILRKLGYGENEISTLIDYLNHHGSFYGSSLKKEHLELFKTSLPANLNEPIISPEEHIRILKYAQPFISGAISKTINCPNSITPEEIGILYRKAYEGGLKGISIYRDGCKFSQPLNVKGENEEKCGYCGGDTKPSGSCRVCMTCGQTTSCS